MPRQPRVPTSGRKRRMQVQFPRDDFEALRILAQAHQRSITSEVVLAIREHLARQADHDPPAHQDAKGDPSPAHPADSD